MGRFTRRAILAGVSAPDKIGLSPAVMQANNNFGVAGSVSVNAHGWPAPFGPIGSTVRSLRLMRANGDVIRCSRTDNAELFSLAMGGYGLITDLELDMVPNALLTPTYAPRHAKI